MPFARRNSGFPEGQRRAKHFAEALRMEIAAAGDDHKALRRVARALLAAAYKGNVAAATMIADRLDGKVPQPTGGSDDLGPQRLHISWITHQHHYIQHDRALAAPALIQEGIDGQTKERDPAVRCAELRPAGAAQEPDAQGT
jgi:hypothetical protein